MQQSWLKCLVRSKSMVSLAVFLLGGMAVSADPADGASMVKDIKTEAAPLWTFASPVGVVGNNLVISSFDDSHQSGFWLSDGTPAGTSFISNPCQYSDASYFMAYKGVNLGNKVIFNGYCPDTGSEIWATDGTASGTCILKDIYPGPEGNNQIWRDGVVQSMLYFWADDGVHGTELWKTDGTPDGTLMVKDINPGADSTGGWSSVAALGGIGIFGADDGVHGYELWRTDGTDAGTTLIKDICPGACGSNPSSFATLGPYVYFSTQPAPGQMPTFWRTDGTEAGTTAVMGLSFCSFISGIVMASWKGSLYIAGGGCLWRSNGTQAGTVVLKYNVGYVYDLAPAQDVLYFFSNDLQDEGALWRTDGTSSGTFVVHAMPHDAFSGWGNTAVAGNLIYYETDDMVNGILIEHLWRSDGTASGTYELLSTPPWDQWAWFSNLVIKDGLLYLGAQGTGDFGSIWRSDGTVPGTIKVVQVQEGISSYPDLYWAKYLGATVGGTVLFSADDGVHGEELWRSDGTETGTSLLVDFFPSAESSWPWMAQTSIGMFLTAWNFEYSASCDGFWKTDGTVSGTTHVPGFQAYDFRELNGLVLMAADDGVHGDELWRTDGTAAGTSIIKDVYPGTGSSSPEFITDFNGFMLFMADDGVHGPELMRTDGTTEGTALVKDINPGPTGSEYYAWVYAVTSDALFFFADDGQHGLELWKTDGTEAGTLLVKDITPGAQGTYFDDVMCIVGNRVLFFVESGGDPQLWGSDGSEVGTFLLTTLQSGPANLGAYWTMSWSSFMFFIANDGIHGRELWVSDGTVAGTRMVKDIYPGVGSSFPWFLLAAPEGVYFSAYEPQTGYELWRTDGTEAGTVQIADIWPGVGSSMPFEAIRLEDGRLIFSARTPEDGMEVWQTDGTAAHTLRWTDIAPGNESSYPHYFVEAGSFVLFQATDGVHGFELWALPTGCAIPPPVFALLSPADHAPNQPLTLTLDWADAGTAPNPNQAVSYDLYFGTAPNPPLYASGLTATKYSVSGLSMGTRYFWKVVANNACGTTASALWAFTTLACTIAPRPFANLSPPNGATAQPLTVDLTWQASTQAAGYQVYLGTDPAHLSLVSTVSDTRYVASGLCASTTYYWQIIAKNACGTRPGAVWSFTTAADDTPHHPRPVSPP